MTENTDWEIVTDGLGTEQAPYWVNIFNDNAISYDGGETYFLLDEPMRGDGTPTMYNVEGRPVPDKFKPKDLTQAVFVALGAASTCWDDAGVFESERACQIGDDLVAWINDNYTKKEAPSA